MLAIETSVHTPVWVYLTGLYGGGVRGVMERDKRIVRAWRGGERPNSEE
jgi:hypothetical protein